MEVIIVSKSFILTLATMGILILIIAIPSVIKVNKRHNDRLMHVTIAKITQSAEDCYYDKICPANKITLKELYDNNYLEEIANPITKEYYNEKSYVIIHDVNNIEFIEEK